MKAAIGFVVRSNVTRWIVGEGSGTVSHAFAADEADGFLFTTGGQRIAITDAVKLAGAGAANAVRYTDIVHGALA